MDMDYALIIEKAKFMFISVYLLGLFTSCLLDRFDRFISFIYKVFCKYMRLRKIKKVKESRCLEIER